MGAFGKMILTSSSPCPSQGYQVNGMNILAYVKWTTAWGFETRITREFNHQALMDFLNRPLLYLETIPNIKLLDVDDSA